MRVKTWVVDLRHFLREDGSLAEMPRPAVRLATYFGQIVRAVTLRGNDSLSTGVRCRRRPSRRLCPGEIIAFIDDQSESAIVWACPVCGDNGIISGWGGTFWDWSVNA